MPRLIDHDARATEITEAAWRVLVRGGVSAVSVRNVAAEAGLATASLRRAFPTQAELLRGCLSLMRERVEARIGALPPTSDRIAWALRALGETMPLDEQRRIEMEVYLTLGTAALSDPSLHEEYAVSDEGLRLLCELIVTDLNPTLDAPDQQREIRHLQALLDGLALHVLHGLPADAAVDVLRSHLERLQA